ncbi:MAG: CBS domain-containing protein [Planctomycetes bacterium]|nr:CBS domain-containing protein [Planctomycetota bacterium]
MQVREWMVPDPVTCPPDAPLSEVARLMWEHDCGFIPVAESGTERLCGVITDRDVCMGAWTRSIPLSHIRASESMSRVVHSCRPTDDVDVVHTLMRREKVRRIPVVEEGGRIVGVVSLNDLARRAFRPPGRSGEAERLRVGETLAAICQPRKVLAGAGV